MFRFVVKCMVYDKKQTTIYKAYHLLSPMYFRLKLPVTKKEEVNMYTHVLFVMKVL